jgi:2,3-bisphosphoglycerate-dependent phosphoglycerate mutase
LVKLLLIRHTESDRAGGVSDEIWPLSETGMTQAKALTDTMANRKIDSVCSSPYTRAIDTVRPLVESRRIEICVEPDLCERRLNDGLIDDWIAAFEQSWVDRNFKLPGCESAQECQDRVFSCIERIMPADSSSTVVACSHGNAIALFINQIEPSFGFENWRAMQNLHIFEFIRAGGMWTFIG